jgi:hypothetical protein
MTCYHPWLACRGHGEKLGRYVPYSSVWAIPGTEIWLPCGQCIGCRLQRSREWAARCVFEASRHEKNSFITLTYAPECLPEDGNMSWFSQLLRITEKTKAREVPTHGLYF